MNTESISSKIREQIQVFKDEGCDRVRVMVSPELYKLFTGSDPNPRLPPYGKTSWHTMYGVPLRALDLLTGDQYSVGGGKSRPQSAKARAMFLEHGAAMQVEDLLNSMSKSQPSNGAAK